MIVSRKRKAKGYGDETIKRYVSQCNTCWNQFTTKTGIIFEESPLVLDII